MPLSFSLIENHDLKRNCGEVFRKVLARHTICVLQDLDITTSYMHYEIREQKQRIF